MRQADGAAIFPRSLNPSVVQIVVVLDYDMDDNQLPLPCTSISRILPASWTQRQYVIRKEGLLLERMRIAKLLTTCPRMHGQIRERPERWGAASLPSGTDAGRRIAVLGPTAICKQANEL